MDNEIPAWAKTLIDLQAKIKVRLDGLEKKDNPRDQAFLKLLEGSSEDFKARELKKFNRMSFETDEDFEEYLNDIAGENKSSNQDSNNRQVTPASEDEVTDVLDRIM